MDCQENTTYLIEWLSMINTVLNQKKNQNTLKKETSYCVECKKNTKKKQQPTKAVALDTKIGQQKSASVHCDSKKSTLLKRVKHKKWFLQIKKHANLLLKV